MPAQLPKPTVYLHTCKRKKRRREEERRRGEERGGEERGGDRKVTCQYFSFPRHDRV